MGKELKLFKDFWNDGFGKGVPSLFDWNEKSLFKGWDDDLSKILNGRCDFEESDDGYSIELEVPGVNRDEIDISLKNDNLTISWSRKAEKKRDKKKKQRYERREGSFSRSFYVEGADIEKINAELKNGVLKITLPKLEEAKPQVIQIN